MNTQQLLAQWDLINLWFMNALEGISDEESNTRINQKMNHIKYLAGHLVNASYGMGVAVEKKLERKWDEHFAGLGKTKAQDQYPYPTIEEIKAEWKHIQPIIREGFAQMNEPTLNKEMPGSSLSQTGIFDGSVGDYLAFMNAHQMYHIGQIGILRRGLGKAPMKLF